MTKKVETILNQIEVLKNKLNNMNSLKNNIYAEQSARCLKGQIHELRCKFTDKEALEILGYTIRK